jgi:hypothetical protein
LKRLRLEWPLLNYKLKKKTEQGLFMKIKNPKTISMTLFFSMFALISFAGCSHNAVKTADESARTIESVSRKSCDDADDFAICVPGKEHERNDEDDAVQMRVQDSSVPYVDSHKDANIN